MQERARRDPEPPDLSPPTIPGYELAGPLGHGGMGVVYKARQRGLDRWVAVKILREELAREPEYVSRFLSEAHLAGRLRHENIVSAIDCGEAGGVYYLAMEYVEGQPLDRVLRARGRLPEREALDLAGRLADALQYAWEHKVLHRDIKPQNILLTRDGTPKISDFGLCRQVEDLPHLTSLGLIHCTPEYASPERARGDRNLDPRSDLYSLGVVLYELLTGTLPFQADSPGATLLKHVMDRPVPPAERNPSISPGANQLVLDLLEKAREERPATPGEAALRMRRLLADEGEARPPERRKRASDTRAVRGARPSLRHRTLRPRGRPAALLLTAAAVAFMLVIGLALARPPKAPVRRETLPGPPAPARVDSMEEFRSRILSHFVGPYELDPAGRVTHWLVAGPFDNEDDGGLATAPVAQAERDPPFAGRGIARPDGSLVFWSQQETPGGMLDLSAIKGWEAEPPLAALAAFWIECLQEVSAELRFSTTGGYELLLDRRLLASSHIHRKSSDEPVRRPVTLAAGWHLVLVKADHIDAKLTLQLRLVTPQGGKPAGMKIWN